jgi:hypothetical protein
MINIFFQEWAPLFPVLHRPTFLGLYEKYVASPESMVDKKSIAQLNLVFGIAALSSDVRVSTRPKYMHALANFDSRMTAKILTHLSHNGRALLTRS